MAVLAIIVAGIVAIIYVMAHLHGQRTIVHKDYSDMTPAEKKKFERAAEKMDEAFKKMNEAWDELR